jgi:hypothetical protein
MSYSIQPIITCDEPHCGQWSDAYGLDAKEMRKNARSYGWAVSLPGGKDYCPKHAPRAASR